MSAFMEPFHGVLALEGEWTLDNRIIVAGALEWRIPIPLMFGGSHFGRIETIARRDSKILCGGRSARCLPETAVAVDLMSMDAGWTEVRRPRWAFWRPREPRIVIDSARIVGATLVEDPAWPETTLIWSNDA